MKEKAREFLSIAQELDQLLDEGREKNEWDLKFVDDRLYATTAAMAEILLTVVEVMEELNDRVGILITRYELDQRNSRNENDSSDNGRADAGRKETTGSTSEAP